MNRQMILMERKQMLGNARVALNHVLTAQKLVANDQGKSLPLFEKLIESLEDEVHGLKSTRVGPPK